MKRVAETGEGLMKQLVADFERIAECAAGAQLDYYFEVLFTPAHVTQLREDVCNVASVCKKPVVFVTEDWKIRAVQTERHSLCSTSFSS